MMFSPTTLHTHAPHGEPNRSARDSRARDSTRYSNRAQDFDGVETRLYGSGRHDGYRSGRACRMGPQRGPARRDKTDARQAIPISIRSGSCA
jgi:hypothetical protein